MLRGFLFPAKIRVPTALPPPPGAAQTLALLPRCSARAVGGCRRTSPRAAVLVHADGCPQGLSHDSAAAGSVAWSARLQRRVLRNRARAACPAQVSPSVTVKPRDLPTRGWASLWCATRGTDPNDRWSAPTPRTARRAAARRGRSWLQSGWRIALGSHARSALAPCTQAMADQRDCDAREGDPQQCRLGCGGDDLVSQNRHQPVPAHGCHRLRAA